MRRYRGRSRSTDLRLCSRAPRITRESDTTAHATGGSADLFQLTAQFLDLVTKASGVFESEISRRFGHLLLERVDETSKFIARKFRELGSSFAIPFGFPSPITVRNWGTGSSRGSEIFEYVGHRPAHGLRIDAMLLVIGLLEFATPIGLADGPFHRTGDRVRVHDDLTGDVSGSTTDRLDE